jgi:hypothetical protein
MPFKIILRIKKLNVYIDHFLLFSETPESTFNKFIDNYNLIELDPLLIRINLKIDLLELP